MGKTLIISSVLFLLLIFPVVVVGAQIDTTPLGNIFINIHGIINTIIYILMSVATAVFLWGMVKYISSGADEKTKEASKGTIKAGIIGLFMMVAIWGIVNVLVRTFGVGNDGTPIGPGYKNPKIRERALQYDSHDMI